MKKTVEDAYTEVEYTRGIEPYKVYLRALEEVFDLSIINTFLDVGCSNGRLMESMRSKYPQIQMLGLEYFEWAKKHADKSIANDIAITDLGKPYSFKTQYDIVNCSEVGEHIEPEFEEIFINNLVSATKDILILTWSNRKSDTNGQHVNPHSKRYVQRKLASKGLIFWSEVSDQLSNTLKISLEGIGHGWWAENIMVFKKQRFVDVKSRYYVQGISTDNDAHKRELARKSLYTYGANYLQADFKWLTNVIHTRLSDRKGASILRASDGDYLFLREIAKGSATPGRRAITKDYKNFSTALFRSLFWSHDVVALNLEKHAIGSWRRFVLTEFPEKVCRRLFKKRFALFQNKYVRYGIDQVLRPFTVDGILPLGMAYLYALKRGKVYLMRAHNLIKGNVIACDAIYALVSTKWIFRNFSDSIGIVASAEKIKLIKALMEKEEYRMYLGVTGIVEYIEVPQKGAADDVEALARSVSTQLKQSKAKVFLVGAGSSKIALMPLMRLHSDAVFIDVGVGIDAIAGIVCQERPYFAEWTNYRLKNYDYSTIDFMDKGNPAWDNPSYKTKYI